MSETNVIEAHGIRKRFGRHEVLEGLDLVLRPGQILGISGPMAAENPYFCAFSPG